MVVFAKSSPLNSPQSLLDHTADVVNNAKKLKTLYGTFDFLGENEQYFWDALVLVSTAHDLGKLASPFQYEISKNINSGRRKACPDLPLINTVVLQQQAQNIPTVPHNILSPSFVIDEISQFPKHLRKYLYQAIAFHHNRGINFLDNYNWGFVKDAINNDLKGVVKNSTEIKQLLSKEPNLKPGYLEELLDSDDSAHSQFYVMLKGLLHRADYCASAGVEISINAPNYNTNAICNNMAKNYPDNWQSKLLKDNFNQNVVLEAGTGMGKTEFALSWTAGSKTFYTLPIRTSVNAIYERVKDAFTLTSDQVGLLHSDVASYLLSSIDNTEKDSMDTTFESIDIMYNLSMPISISTADQLFTSVFHYPGYERIYSIMTNAKIVVDEIQAYDPQIIAAILYGLVDFSKYGAKFCIITATLPEFCLDYLNGEIPDIKKPPIQYKILPRHKIQVENQQISADIVINIIKQKRKDSKKFLIILNTVDAAISLKQELEERNYNPNLLHARFIYEDRYEKENNKNNGILHVSEGIWITTQVVEASVNIDFDVLITEISTMDSQIQRWGRIWRNRDKLYDKDDPNIFITTNPSDKGNVYDTDLVEQTQSILETKQNLFLSDKDEYDLFHSIFSTDSLHNTEYLEAFYRSIDLLKRGYTTENKKKAQELFRDIPNISAIPLSVYLKYKKLIDEKLDILSHENKKEKSLARVAIKNKTVSFRHKQNISSKLEPLDDVRKIYTVDLDYSFDYGLQF